MWNSPGGEAVLDPKYLLSPKPHIFMYSHQRDLTRKAWSFKKYPYQRLMKKHEAWSFKTYPYQRLTWWCWVLIVLHGFHEKNTKTTSFASHSCVTRALQLFSAPFLLLWFHQHVHMSQASVLGNQILQLMFHPETTQSVAESGFWPKYFHFSFKCLQEQLKQCLQYTGIQAGTERMQNSPDRTGFIF